MKYQKKHSTERSGLVVVMNILTSQPSAPNDDADNQPPIPRPEGIEKQSTEHDAVENLPLEKPEVEHTERETPDISEIDENRPMDRPEINPIETPQPDLDELDPTTDREISSDPIEEEEESHLDRDPSIQPDTDPSTTGNTRVF